MMICHFDMIDLLFHPEFPTVRYGWSIRCQLCASVVLIVPSSAKLKDLPSVDSTSKSIQAIHLGAEITMTDLTNIPIQLQLGEHGKHISEVNSGIILEFIHRLVIIIQLALGQIAKKLGIRQFVAQEEISSFLTMAILFNSSIYLSHFWRHYVYKTL